jgi:hypothetical protein
MFFFCLFLLTPPFPILYLVVCRVCCIKRFGSCPCPLTLIVLWGRLFYRLKAHMCIYFCAVWLLKRINCIKVLSDYKYCLFRWLAVVKPLRPLFFLTWYGVVYWCPYWA